MGYKIISVDFQKEFTSPDGNFYQSRPCIDFIKNEFVPFAIRNRIKIHEINSDYRNVKFKNGKDC